MKCITAGLFMVLGLVGQGVLVSAACAKNLLVDDFAKFAGHVNTLGEYTSGEFLIFGGSGGDTMC